MFTYNEFIRNGFAYIKENVKITRADVCEPVIEEHKVKVNTPAVLHVGDSTIALKQKLKMTYSTSEPT